MAESILRGYLIDKRDFAVFDEMITFITPHGKKYACLSKGSRKIESKNARNLFIGNLIEFEIFQARSEEKVSRLKKAVIIESLDWSFETCQSFNLLNECINVLPSFNEKAYKFYLSSLEMIKTKDFDDKKNILIILVEYCKILGIQLEVNRCVLCGSNKVKTISLKQYGMLCDECFDIQQHQSFDLPISKLIHYLFNEKYSEIDSFSQSYDQVIGLLLVFIKDNAGIQLKTLKHYWM